MLSKYLQRKNLIEKQNSPEDKRAYTIKITQFGEKIIQQAEHYTQPIQEIISRLDDPEKISLYHSISSLIYHLNQTGIIQVQRMCFRCAFYQYQRGKSYCHLMKQDLQTEQIRLDCPEFKSLG